ncbi:hypothetical protein BC567DRAFT_228118 [Phyllosticta citribraziliensis]
MVEERQKRRPVVPTWQGVRVDSSHLFESMDVGVQRRIGDSSSLSKSTTFDQWLAARSCLTAHHRRWPRCKSKSKNEIVKVVIKIEK